MFNPWFSFTFQAARLGFEAQSAMAHRFMGLLGDAGKTEIPGMIAGEIAAAPDVRATADELDIVATADRAVSAGRSRRTVAKVHKKQVRTSKRRRSKQDR